MKSDDFDPVIYSRQCPKCFGTGETRRGLGAGSSRTSCTACNGWGKIGIHGNAFPMPHPRYDSGRIGVVGRISLILIGLAVLGVLGLAVLFYLPTGA